MSWLEDTGTHVQALWDDLNSLPKYGASLEREFLLKQISKVKAEKEWYRNAINELIDKLPNTMTVDGFIYSRHDFYTRNYSKLEPQNQLILLKNKLLAGGIITRQEFNQIETAYRDEDEIKERAKVSQKHQQLTQRLTNIFQASNHYLVKHPNDEIPSMDYARYLWNVESRPITQNSVDAFFDRLKRLGLISPNAKL